jgi:aryl-alcohol dehydrogenase-like predicted oxidoreductase
VGADGRARHLKAACEASCRTWRRPPALIAHAPIRGRHSPRARALARAATRWPRRVDRLCNVTVGQIEQARDRAIAAVQVELSVWHDEPIAGGVAATASGTASPCSRIAHSADRRAARAAADPVLSGIAVRHGGHRSTSRRAWLRDFSDSIVPLPGPSRPETVAESRTRSSPY